MNINQIYEEAVALYEQGYYEEAMVKFREIMYDYETYSPACYYGICLTRLGEYEKSITLFEKLLKLCSDWESLWYNLGDAYLKSNNKEKALFCLLKAEEIAPEHPNTLFYLGLYYEKAAKTVKKAYTGNISLKEACVALGFLTPEQFDAVFHPEQMI